VPQRCPGNSWKNRESDIVKARFRAFLIHLSISAVVVGLVVAAAYFFWYPSPLLMLQGGAAIITLLMAVDIVLGPSLTFIVYKPGKPSLAFDLSVIACIQTCALAYGVFVVYSERPVHIVFSYNQFHVVRSGDLIGQPPSSIDSAPRYGVLGPRVVYAKPSPDGGALLAAIMGDPRPALSATRYEVFPFAPDLVARESFRPEDVIPVIGREVAALAGGRDVGKLQYFYVRGRAATGVAVVDPNQARLIGIVEGDISNMLTGKEPVRPDGKADQPSSGNPGQ
jgi:hypothetical protein